MPLTEVDSSRLHPLDHWPLSQRCAHHHGGSVNHVRLWWAYRATPLLRMNTLCLVGWHDWAEMFRGPGPDVEGPSQSILVCHACNKERS
jgi:hypothetical protein